MGRWVVEECCQRAVQVAAENYKRQLFLLFHLTIHRTGFGPKVGATLGANQLLSGHGSAAVGTVKHGDAANPAIGIQGAIVQITGTGGSYQATSGPTGLYEITNIAPGTYEGMVTHPDYETAYF